ncbi:MAG: glycosyltransferase [Sedimentisphaerales bacterium]|nr:glycosyltransferase [Sedimentisphaerales bacterium]
MNRKRRELTRKKYSYTPVMSENYYTNDGPVVSVLIPTYNRPQSLYKALVSVFRQDYENLQVIVVNDGGEDVRDIVDSFHDSRLEYICRNENRGKAYSLNEAIGRSEGKYLCYLDDDDIYYPFHVRMLVDALENETDCQVAYSDLYKVYCNQFPDGTQQVLSKVVEVSRDFDRFLMLVFNHVLHVSLMHHRDLIEKTGPYNERLNVLIDWDMTRRLMFFSDFYHVPEITGEYSHPAGDSDRISVQRRKDKNEYMENVLTIMTTRPPKPWPKFGDLSIIFISERLDKRAGKTIGEIRHRTFYPYKLFLPMPESDFNRLNIDMPNLVFVSAGSSSCAELQLDTALKKCDGEYIALVPADFSVRDLWIENPIYALINCSDQRQGFLLDKEGGHPWAAVFRRDDLRFARTHFSDLSISESLKAAGISIRWPRNEELPFQFDNLYNEALSIERDGDWLEAAQIYEYIAEKFQNRLWMKRLAARAFFKAGRHEESQNICNEINRWRPTVDTLFLEAKIRRENGDLDSAIELLTTAAKTLEGHELIWT